MAKKSKTTAAAADPETVITLQDGTTLSGKDRVMSSAVAEAVVRPMTAATKVYNLTADQIAAAIEQGDIANVGSTDVTISAKSSPTGKDEVQAYERLIALTFDGALLLSGGKMEPKTDAPAEGKDTRTDFEKQVGACDHFNYGLDLDTKRDVRRDLSEEIEGPSKIITQTAQKMVDAKLFDTLAEAVADVKARRIAKNLPV